MKSHSVSKSEINEDIRRVARLLNHSPSSVEYKRFGKYHLRTVQKKYSLSWQAIINAAGLRYTSRTVRRIPTTEELQTDLIRVARELQHPPTRAEYQRRGKFGAETIRRRSRKKHWADAVSILTNFDHEAVKCQQQRGGCYRSTNDWLAKLRGLSEQLGHAPTTGESNKGGINAQQLCLRIGGNWIDVLQAAGIDLTKRSKHARLLSTSTETLIDDVVAVSRRLGHPARALEYAACGHYPYTTLRGRLGGWRKVKKVVMSRLSYGNSFERAGETHNTAEPNSTMNSIVAIHRFFHKTQSINNSE